MRVLLGFCNPQLCETSVADHFSEDLARGLRGKRDLQAEVGVVFAEADEDGEYLLKVQGDDNIVVWVNGARVIRITEKGPSIRTAREVKISLKKGRNRILFRLNQRQNQWQASIRIRTKDDKVANIKGIPFSEQETDFYP